MQQEILDLILNAKEELYAKKTAYIKYTGMPLVSINLNVPGYPKSNKLYRNFFFTILEDFFLFARANRINILHKKAQIQDTHAGLQYFGPTNYKNPIKSLKDLSETFEEEHDLGRFIDVDIYDHNGKNISSGKQKSCFICSDTSAQECRQNHSHTPEELRIFQCAAIKKWLDKRHKQKQVQILTEYTTYALLEEASLHPKPGLVTPVSNGAHSDMDFHTFTRSIAAITPIFNDFFQTGITQSKPFSISTLRLYGLRAEKCMRNATNGINTHKGAIFLFLLLGNSVLNIIKENKEISNGHIKQELAKFTDDIINDPAIKEDNTNGNNILNNHPEIKAGIRNQLASGFSGIFDVGILPLQTHYYSPTNNTAKRNWILQLSLLSIMAKNVDSNVIHRGGIEKISILQKKSEIEYNKLLQNKLHNYLSLDTWCKKQNISPGGSADLLSATIFIYLCKQNPNLKPYEL